MQSIDLSIGTKIYSIQCSQKDIPIIESLAGQLNILVNKNILKYRGLCAENLLLITTLEILAKNNQLQSNLKKSTNTTSAQLDLIKTESIDKVNANIKELELFIDTICKQVSILEKETRRA